MPRCPHVPVINSRWTRAPRGGELRLRTWRVRWIFFRFLISKLTGRRPCRFLESAAPIGSQRGNNGVRAWYTVELPEKEQTFATSTLEKRTFIIFPGKRPSLNPSQSVPTSIFKAVSTLANTRASVGSCKSLSTWVTTHSRNNSASSQISSTLLRHLQSQA